MNAFDNMEGMTRMSMTSSKETWSGFINIFYEAMNTPVPSKISFYKRNLIVEEFYL